MQGAANSRRRRRARSGDQLLPDGLGHGLAAVARAELALRLFEVTAHGLLAKLKRLGNFRRLPSR